MKDKIIGIIIHRLDGGKTKYISVLVGSALGMRPPGGPSVTGRVTLKPTAGMGSAQKSLRIMCYNELQA
jgi:hypothetical protein